MTNRTTRRVTSRRLGWTLASVAALTWLLTGPLAAQHPAPAAVAPSAPAAMAPHPVPAAAALLDDACLRPDPQAPTLYLLTMAPGGELWSAFGHSSVWVQPPGERLAGTVYNFGAFFETDGLLERWLRGEQAFFMDTGAFTTMLDRYGGDERTIIAQRLELTPAQALAARDHLDLLTSPEQSAYLYHWRHNNCSTRTRDALDHFVGGALAPQHIDRHVIGHTRREEVLRHLRDLPELWLGLQLTMNAAADVIMSDWEAMFLPDRLLGGLERSVVLDARGQPRPLVRCASTLKAGRLVMPPPAGPPWGWGLLLAGLTLGAALAALGALAGRHVLGRLTLALALVTIGAALATLSAVMIALWSASTLDVFQGNANLLQLSPATALLLLAAVGVALGRRGALRVAWWCAALPLALSLAGALWWLTPWSLQANAPIIALSLPLLCGALAGVWLTARGRGLRVAPRWARRALSRLRPRAPRPGD